jgi:hypothetical protein
LSSPISALLSAPFRVSVQQMKRLVDSGEVHLLPTSPFGFLQFEKSELTDASENSSKDTELVQDRELLLESLAVLATPEGRLRISMASPPSRYSVLNLFIKNERVVSAYYDRKGFEIGRTTSRNDFLDALASQFVTRQQNHEPQLFLTGHIRIASILWPGSRTKAVNPISVELAIRELGRAGVAKDTATAVIRSLTRGKCLREQDEELFLSDSFRHWMSLFWSKHSLRLQYKVLLGEPIGALSRREKVMMMVGPPGERCQCSTMRVRQVLADTGLLGDTAFSGLEDGTLLQFSYFPSHSSALSALQRFLLLSPSVTGGNSSATGATTSSASPSTENATKAKPDPSLVRTCSHCGAPTGTRRFCTKCGKRVE